jgi:hypothetical protein
MRIEISLKFSGILDKCNSSVNDVGTWNIAEILATLFFFLLGEIKISHFCLEPWCDDWIISLEDWELPET